MTPTDDILLGSYGAKWSHGWVPLNPQATALKLKQLHGGDSGAHVADHGGGHGIVVAKLRNGKYGALVHSETGGHYSVHASRATAIADAQEHVATVRGVTNAEKIAKAQSRVVSLPGAPAHVSATRVGRGRIKVTDSIHNDSIQVHESHLASAMNQGHKVNGVTAGRLQTIGDSGAHHSFGPGMNDGKVEVKADDGKTIAERAGITSKAETVKPVPQSRKPKASNPKSKRGHYLVGEEPSNAVWNPDTKKAEPAPPTHVIHRVVQVDPLGRPVKVEDVSTGARSDYNPGRHKYGESIPGDRINGVALDRAMKDGRGRKFATREEALAAVNAHSGEAPKRVVRIPDGLTVQPGKESGHVVMHHSGKTVGISYKTKGDAENAATHFGTTGVDWTKGAESVVADIKAKGGNDHPALKAASGRYGSNYGKVEPVFSDSMPSTGLSPHTPPVKDNTRAGKVAAAQQELFARFGSEPKDLNAMGRNERKAIKPGHTVKFTYEGKGVTGHVISTGTDHTYVYSPDTKLYHEVHGGYSGKSWTGQQMKDYVEAERKQHDLNVSRAHAAVREHQARRA